VRLTTLKIDSALPGRIRETKDAAVALEAAGYDALWSTETKHDPFLQLLQAAEATRDVSVGSAIAVAFARSPMTLASAAFDLAEYSSGRFVLGIGSQIKAHIERRFSMPWSSPAARMREFVLAMQAIWSCWQEGTPLDFDGEFYSHTLMTPFFSPDPHEFGAPPVFLAGVGDKMTEVAGEVCSGLLLHAFTTQRYLEEVTIPALLRGRRSAGVDGLAGFTIAGMCMVCPGRDEEELAKAIRTTKKQIAFYASTPAYRGVLDLHGWGDLQPELTRLSKAGRWDEMGELIDDEVLDAVAVVGDPASVGRGLRERWGDLIERTTLYVTYDVADSVLEEIATSAR
jgi:probable F420-dependent oxidoreductase